MGMGFQFEQHRLGLWDLSWDLKKTISWEMGLGPPPPLHHPLVCQSHSPSGAQDSPRQSRWNHSTRHLGLLQAIISPYSPWPQIEAKYTISYKRSISF